MLRLGNADRVLKYGTPKSQRARESVLRRQLTNPNSLTEVKFWSHRQVADQVVLGFTRASFELNEWPSEIQSYNIRTIRGTKTWSLHSWALAWDIFDNDGRTTDPKTGRSTMSPEWFRLAAKHGGLVWGGEFRNPDPHHIEFPY